MRITLSGKHIDLSDALREHATRQLETVATKYFGHALDARVTIGREHREFQCDIDMHAGPGLLLHGKGSAADAYAAIDVAATHLGTRLRRYRRRLNDHTRDLGRREQPDIGRRMVLESDEDPPEVITEETGTHPVIVAETETSIALLTVGEAAMHLDLGNQTCLMFRNSGSRALNVVYRRPDGNVGWIDPVR